MYFFLFFALIVLLILSYIVFERDILHPAVFLVFYFCAAVILSFYLYDYWHLYEYMSKTVFIILLGLISFFVGSFLAKLNKVRYTFGVNRKQFFRTMESERVDVSTVAILFMIFICLLTIILFIVFYRSNFSAGRLLSNISKYKAARNDGELSLPGYINFLIKLNCAFSIVGIIIFENNTILKKYKNRDLLLLIPTIVYFFISLLSGNRGNILIFIISAFCGWYILYHRVNGWDKKITWKAVFVVALIAAVSSVLFWAFMIFVKNEDVSSSANGFMTYVCAYISGPLAGINMYIRQGAKVDPQWWGQETFVALNNNLNHMFGISHESTRFLEFRSGFEFSVVNVYSSFRRFYHDFGMVGVFLLSLIQGYVSSRIYYLVKRSKNTGIDILMCVYAFFFYTVPYTLTDELFYSSNFSVSGFIKLLIFFIAYFILMFRADNSKQKIRC